MRTTAQTVLIVFVLSALTASRQSEPDFSQVDAGRSGEGPIRSC